MGGKKGNPACVFSTLPHGIRSYMLRNRCAPSKHKHEEVKAALAVCKTVQYLVNHAVASCVGKKGYEIKTVPLYLGGLHLSDDKEWLRGGLGCDWIGRVHSGKDSHKQALSRSGSTTPRRHAEVGLEVNLFFMRQLC